MAAILNTLSTVGWVGVVMDFGELQTNVGI